MYVVDMNVVAFEIRLWKSYRNEKMAVAWGMPGDASLISLVLVVVSLLTLSSGSHCYRYTHTALYQIRNAECRTDTILL